MRDINISSSLNPLKKFTSSSRNTEFKDILAWNISHSQTSHKDHLNQHENSHKPCDETGYPLLSVTKGQWKLGQQHDQNFPMEEQTLALEERKQSKSAGL